MMCPSRWAVSSQPRFPAPTLHQIFGENPVQEFETLKQMVNEAEEDIRKAEGGNKAAGTRARKTMQDIKNLAQDIRKKILELRTDGE